MAEVPAQVNEFRKIVNTVIDRNIETVEARGWLTMDYKRSTSQYGMEFVRFRKVDGRSGTFGYNKGDTL